MKLVIAALLTLCTQRIWADGTPESDAFLTVSNSVFCTATNEATTYVPSDLPPQVWSIMRPYISNPEIDPATVSNVPSHVNGFYVDLNADGSKEYIIQVNRFGGTAGPFYVLLANTDGEWKEAATLQGYFYLSETGTNAPIITYIRRGGSEDYLRQEYILENGCLKSLSSQNFEHGVITEDELQKTEPNRVEQGGPGYPPQGVGSPDP